MKDFTSNAWFGTALVVIILVIFWWLGQQLDNSCAHKWYFIDRNGDIGYLYDDCQGIDGKFHHYGAPNPKHYRELTQLR